MTALPCSGCVEICMPSITPPVKPNPQGIPDITQPLTAMAVLGPKLPFSKWQVSAAVAGFDALQTRANIARIKAKALFASFMRGLPILPGTRVAAAGSPANLPLFQRHHKGERTARAPPVRRAEWTCGLTFGPSCGIPEDKFLWGGT